MNNEEDKPVMAYTVATMNDAIALVEKHIIFVSRTRELPDGNFHVEFFRKKHKYIENRPSF